MIQVNKADFSPCNYDEDTLEMTITYHDKEVILSVYVGSESIDELLTEINAVTTKLATFDQEGKYLIADELLDAYNQHNAEASLTEEAFKNKLDLVSLYFSGDEEVEFTYEANGMFGTNILSIELVEGTFTDWVSMNG